MYIDRVTYAKYREMVNHAIDKLDDKLKKYEKDPQSHPLYPIEWNIFWNKRSDELKAGEIHKFVNDVVFFKMLVIFVCL